MRQGAVKSSSGQSNVLRNLLTGLTNLQGRWFDAVRNVKTSGSAAPDSFTLAGSGKSGFDYLPTRPARARQVLRALPIKDYSQYTFVDLGSGKGRMLFLAAEFPFRGIEGVEFAQELHAQALENLARGRRLGRRDRIRSLHLDAVDYQFPLHNLVLYLFNPFGPAVLKKVLKNLGQSLQQQPRHVVLVLMTPEFADVVAAQSFLHTFRKTACCHIYQNLPQG